MGLPEVEISHRLTSSHYISTGNKHPEKLIKHADRRQASLAISDIEKRKISELANQLAIVFNAIP